jgi:subtilisin family serine protease
VIDTGVAEHPYLDDKDILPGHSAYSDDEGDAWHDRPSGWDPALDDPDIEDKQGHGTAVISQVLLAAPEATILPVRTGTGVADGFGNLFLDGATEIEAVRWAVDNGADAIVMAWGIGTETNEDVHMAMQYAVDHDVILIASAGNDPEASTTGQFPAFLRGVVTLVQEGDTWLVDDIA